MHTQDITIDSITKIEGNAELKVRVEDGKVTDLKFIISDYRRFYTEAVKGKQFNGVPAMLSRICGTCSSAHQIASIEAIEKALGIQDQISEQTRTLRKLIVNGMIIRDHALHLYLFSLPDVLKIDSVLQIEESDEVNHQLLHDAFDLKAIGNLLSTTFAGAAIHAPLPIPGGFLKLPDGSSIKDLISKLEDSRIKVLRGIKVFGDWNAELSENTDFVALVNSDYSFTEGQIEVNSGEYVYPDEKFLELFDEVVVPYSQSKSYTLKGKNEDYLVGALARMNLNSKSLHSRTKADAAEFITHFPTTNIYKNCLAQAIEILHCIDQSIEILQTLTIQSEKPLVIQPKAGIGIGVIEAPRGILYHKIELNDKGFVTDCDVIVPTSQNQMNIENSLKKMFQEKISALSENELKHEAEQIIRAYDPCMSCTTNFLKLTWE